MGVQYQEREIDRYTHLMSHSPTVGFYSLMDKDSPTVGSYSLLDKDSPTVGSYSLLDKDSPTVGSYSLTDKHMGQPVQQSGQIAYTIAVSLPWFKVNVILFEAGPALAFLDAPP